MKLITIVNVSFKSIFVILVFFLIMDPGDYLFIPILNSCGFIGGGVFGFSLMMKSYNVRFIKVPLGYVYKVFKDSLFLFLSKLSSLIKEKSNFLLLGIFTSVNDIAYYDLGIKVLNIITAFLQNIPAVLLPSFTKAEGDSKGLLLGSFKIMFLLGFSSFILLLFFSKPIVGILGGEAMGESIVILRILAFLVLFLPFNVLLNYYFVSVGRNQIVFHTLLQGTIVFFSAVLVLYFIGQINLETLTISFVVASVVEFYLKISRFKRLF